MFWSNNFNLKFERSPTAEEEDRAPHSAFFFLHEHWFLRIGRGHVVLIINHHANDGLVGYLGGGNNFVGSHSHRKSFKRYSHYFIYRPKIGAYDRGY